MTHFRKLFVCAQNAGSMQVLCRFYAGPMGGLGYLVY